MAKVVITIEDIDGGKVRVVATPNFAQLMGLQANGSGWTAAEGYAASALNHIRTVAKDQKPTNIIRLPKLN